MTKKESISISTIDALTGCLGLTEIEINSGKSIFKDTISFRIKEIFSDINVTVIGYNIGEYIEVVLDHDSENRCINQKFYSLNFDNMKKHILPDNTDIYLFFLQKGYWPEVYIPRLGKKVRFSIGNGVNEKFIQADIELD